MNVGLPVLFSRLYNIGMEEPRSGASIGERILTLRTQRGWSLRKLALYSGVSHAYISLLETGKIDRPSMKHISKLAGALEIGVEELIGVASLPEVDEADALQDHIKRLAAYYGGPNADWRELEIVVASIFAIRDQDRRKQEIAYLQGLASRLNEPDHKVGDD